MNVLFVALGIYSREGGIERFNRRVLECLSGEAPGTAHVIALWDTAADAAACPPRVSFTPCGAGKIRALWSFVRSLRSERPDVVLYGHVLLAPLALFGRVLRRRATNVLIAHGYEVWDRPGPLRRRLIRAAIDRVASVSDYTAESMAGAYGMDGSRFLRVINGIDARGDEPVVPPSIAALPGPKLLCVSRLNPLDRHKHVDKVIGALPQILERAGDVHLYVAGDGAWRRDLESLVRSLSLDDHVHLLGAVSDEDREGLYASSDVFVLPSTQEGFGIVYLEAWRHRLPVIAGAGGAAPEVVRDGEEGLVVEPTPDAIADAVVRLLEDPALRRRLGEAGHARLVGSFTSQHFDEAFVEMLRRAAAA